jgi:hypothetical protein
LIIRIPYSAPQFKNKLRQSVFPINFAERLSSAIDVLGAVHAARSINRDKHVYSLERLVRLRTFEFLNSVGIHLPKFEVNLKKLKPIALRVFFSGSAALSTNDTNWVYISASASGRRGDSIYKRSSDFKIKRSPNENNNTVFLNNDISAERSSSAIAVLGATCAARSTRRDKHGYSL